VARLAHADYGPVGVRVLALHPGWVRTDMGGPNADVAIADGVAGMRGVIAARAAHPGGSFLDWRGRPIAW